MGPLDTVFSNLDQWRHLPNYQLERRADIFFSVYLKDVVEELTKREGAGVSLANDILPEFPIKRDLIRPELPTNKSVKVGYALFAKDRSRVFFVELKTDAASRRDGQDAYLEKAKGLRFRRIVEGVRAILLTTSAHQKYHHLAVVLARLGYLTLPSDIWTYMAHEPDPRLLSQLEQIVVSADDPAVEVIYIQPEATQGDRCIDFATFADHVGSHTDPFSKMFAEHLRKWRSLAGAQQPVV